MNHEKLLEAVKLSMRCNMRLLNRSTIRATEEGDAHRATRCAAAHEALGDLLKKIERCEVVGGFLEKLLQQLIIWKKELDEEDKLHLNISTSEEFQNDR